MLTRESKIKEAVLHPEEEIRLYAVNYFSAGRCPDESVMPLVIQAVEKYGRETAFEILHDAVRLPQTEATIDWVVEELRRQYDPSDVRRENNCFVLAWIRASNRTCAIASWRSSRFWARRSPSLTSGGHWPCATIGDDSICRFTERPTCTSPRTSARSGRKTDHDPLSGRVLKEGSGKQQMRFVAGQSFDSDPWDTTFALMDVVIRRWSAKQAQAILGALQGWPHAKTAIHCTPPIERVGVTRSLADANWRAIERALQVFKSKFDAANG